MMIKKLNLVQVNFAQGPRELNAFYLPYSVGVLWSYAASIPAVAASWELNQLAWRRDPIDSVYKQLADCDVIGFSSYVWNKSYNYELAKQIKAYNPHCTIVFGGPEPAIERTDIFQQHPYIDIIVKKECEIAFANILEHGAGSHIKGIIQNVNGRPVDRGDAPRITHLDQIPSPYTTGVFDRIIAENPEVTWNATLETNRGCPYQCTFCDWGSLTYNKVKQFDLERVFNDLEWMGHNHCDWMSITDANFGMFVKRDEAIVEKLLEVQDIHGYPRRMGVSWAKNQKSDVARLSRKLMNKGFNNGLTLSVQSMDEGVLDAIKRKNLDMHKLEEMFDICAREGMTVNTELILGLPGENVTSWQANVWKLLELGQHSGIEFFQAQLLENAEMNLTQRTENAMTAITVYDYMSGADQNDAYPEGIEVVTSTKDLPLDDMLACQEFQWFINTWHINGISQWYSRFLHKNLGISYADFYLGFQQWLKHTPWWCEERDLVMSAYRSWMTTGTIAIEPVAGVKIHGWNLIHLTNLRMHATNTHSRYLSAVHTYVDQQYGDLLWPNNVRAYNDLRKISDAYVIKHNKMQEYPLQVNTDSNILDYLINNHTLEVRYDPYVFELPEDKNMSLPIFLQNIYYSRRRNFGKAQLRTNA